MERVVRELQLGKISREEAINRVADQGLENVVPSFQTIGHAKSIQLKGPMLAFSAKQMNYCQI
jgi:hypothetical protein